MTTSDKNRLAILRALIPILRKSHPEGVVSRAELLAACEAAGRMDVHAGVMRGNHWITGRKADRGRYDVSSYYLVDTTVTDEEIIEGERERPDTRTDAEVDADVTRRFAALDVLASGVVDGAFRAMILSGAPGVGKSYGMEQILSRANGIKYEHVTGFSRATGLYRLLWEHREDTSVLLMDDCDSIFNDEVALSLLKAACDSSRQRNVAWRSESTMVDDDGEPLPRHFEFRGRFIFVTNLDFEARSESDRGLSPHLKAMLSRSYYVDLHLTPRELLSRVMSVGREILKGCSAHDRDLVLSYLREQSGLMRELSLRTVEKARSILDQCRKLQAASDKAENAFRRIADLTLVSRRAAP